MSKESLDGKEVGAILIEVGAKSMAEGMAGEPVFPAEAVLMGMDMPGKEKGINGPVFPVLLREEKAAGSAVSEPVFGEQVECGFGENGITVMAVFGMRDVEAHRLTLDILIAEGAEFSNPQAGRIQECDHGALF